MYSVFPLFLLSSLEQCEPSRDCLLTACLSCSCCKSPVEDFGTSTASSVPTAPMWAPLVNWMCGQIPAKVNGSWLSQGRKLFSRSGRKLFSRRIRKQHIIPRTGLCMKHEGSYLSSNMRFSMTTWTKHSGVSLQPWGTWETTFLQLVKDPGPQCLLSAEHHKGPQKIPLFFHC